MDFSEESFINVHIVKQMNQPNVRFSNRENWIWDVWLVSVLFLQFFYQSITFLKKTVYF